MVIIRLSKQGKKNDPFYRVVAVDKRLKVSGENLAVLGFWYPKKNEKKIDKKAVQEWIKKGAQVSTTVEKLMK